MYIEDWDTFFLQAQELQRKRPLHTRYCIKYSHKEGKLVLKVTDDVVCLQYKTDQQLDIKRMEKLNTIFFAMMAKGEYDPDEDALPEQQQPQQPPSSGVKAKKGQRRRG